MVGPGSMPPVGHPARRAEYDRRGWAYDDTIGPDPNQMMMDMMNQSMGMLPWMIPGMGTAIGAGKSIYDNWDTIEQFLPPPMQAVTGMAGDAWDAITGLFD
jgi:hypothetical protein